MISGMGFLKELFEFFDSEMSASWSSIQYNLLEVKHTEN